MQGACATNQSFSDPPRKTTAPTQEATPDATAALLRACSQVDSNDEPWNFQSDSGDAESDSRVVQEYLSTRDVLVDRICTYLSSSSFPSNDLLRSQNNEPLSLSELTSTEDSGGTMDLSWRSKRIRSELQVEGMGIQWFQNCLDSIVCTLLFMALTVYVLVVPDIDKMCGTKESMETVSILTTCVGVAFFLELLMQSLVKRSYFCRALFWLDLVALFSLIPDTYLYQRSAVAQNLLSDSDSSTMRTIRMASRSARASRFNRLGRLARLVSILPRLATFVHASQTQEKSRLLERKLKRIFMILDSDCDGCIDADLLRTSMQRIKETLYVKSNITSKRAEASLIGRSDFTSADSGAVTASRSLVQHVGPNELHYEAFRKLMLSDAEVKEILLRTCTEQLNQTNNLMTLAKQHTEDIAIKVAMGVLVVLFVLVLIGRGDLDDSAQSRLERVDLVIQASYPNQTSDPLVPVLIQELVTSWQLEARGTHNTWPESMFHGGQERLRVLYLDLNRRVYCNSLVPKGPSCAMLRPTRRFWGRTRNAASSFAHLDEELLRTGRRVQTDLRFVRVLRGSAGTYAERTSSLAVLDIQDEIQVGAFYTLLTTASVLIIMLICICLLSCDLARLSEKLLQPLRELALEMQGITEMDLTGESPAGVAGKSLWNAQRGTIEIRLIRRAFEHMKMAIKSWSKYAPWPVVNFLLYNGVKANVGVAQKEVTLFFSDIVSFTTIVESLTPEKSLLLLSNYFQEMSKVLEDHGGILLDLIGDAILCMYGAPWRNAQHPTSAVQAALRMIRALNKLNERSRISGLPALQIRCGVHTGHLLVGHTGCRSRIKYGAVGEDAAIPGRLEELNTVYGTRLLVSEATHSRLHPGEFIVRPIDKLRIRVSKDQKPELVYEVLGLRKTSNSSSLDDVATQHADAMSLYLKRDFVRAAIAFDQVRDSMQELRQIEDKPSILMARRCRTYSENTPPLEWDGVWHLDNR